MLERLAGAVRGTGSASEGDEKVGSSDEPTGGAIGSAGIRATRSTSPLTCFRDARCDGVGGLTTPLGESRRLAKRPIPRKS
jgi:hypothetical protein